MRRLSIIIVVCAIFLSAATTVAAPMRIISLKPTITDVIVALDRSSELVGVTRYCDVPGGKAKPAIVGDYTQPSAERIIALAPDIVLGSQENSSRKSIEQLGQMGIRVALFPFSTVAETLASVRGIAKLVDAEAKGEEIARRMENDLAALKKRWDGRAPMRAIVVWGMRPLIVAGPSTYMDELLPFIGATNAIQGTKIAYPRLGLEELIALDPDAIVNLSMGSEAGRTNEGGLPWDGVSQIRAVREGRIVTLDAGLFRAGPNLPASLAKLAELIHRP